ncbi:helix-turn-helix domain-containing protein [Oxobacter pfennigii]|nr:helix-turn-helix domain-containing protein [Oxobacter pfennigii]
MSEKEYSIGEVAAILNEEIHNLRYWQKELELVDRRNEMNQRIYTQTDINTFKFIKELRGNENLSLKAIKKILHKAEIVRDEAAATTEAVIALNNNNEGNYLATIDRFKEDLFEEINRAVELGNQEIKFEIQDLKERMQFMEEERGKKMDELISEWREKNQKKGLLGRIFG